jgi:hypothetical protein
MLVSFKKTFVFAFSVWAINSIVYQVTESELRPLYWVFSIGLLGCLILTKF